MHIVQSLKVSNLSMQKYKSEILPCQRQTMEHVIYKQEKIVGEGPYLHAERHA